MTKRFTFENRIKYMKVRDGVYDTKIFTSATRGAKYKIRLDRNEKLIKIINLGNRNIIWKMENKFEKYMKKKAREKLEKLGVKLEKSIVYHEKSLERITEDFDVSNTNTDDSTDNP